MDMQFAVSMCGWASLELAAAVYIACCGSLPWRVAMRSYLLQPLRVAGSRDLGIWHSIACCYTIGK